MASNGIIAADINGFLNTGSYMLNALLSGSLYGGIPNNKITVFAGEEATGKTFFVLGVCKNFLDNNKDSVVIFFESESAITKNMLEDRGIDSSRMMIIPVSTIQEFRFQSLKVLENYNSQSSDNQRPMIMVLDSLGMLSTTKEMEDTAEGKETKDMTRAAIIKASFRVLTLKLGISGVPLIITNHTYDSMGSMYPTKEMSGGSGLRYASSATVFLGKRKEKDGTEVVGNIIRCVLKKGRLTKENSQAEVLLTYDKGLHPYHGLVDLAVEAGVWKKSSTRIEVDGVKLYSKKIYKNPETYFTPEVMKSLDEYATKKYCYGVNMEEEEEE